MKTLTNQTLYQCDHCGRRLLSKNGAWLHENEYCWHGDSPYQIMEKLTIEILQEECEHKHIETQYSYIPGECVQQPDHNLCVDCGKIM